MDSAAILARHAMIMAMVESGPVKIGMFIVSKAKVDPAVAARQALIDRAWAADTSPTAH